MVATPLLAPRASRSADELVGSVHELMRSVLRGAHPTLEDEGISMGQFWTLHLVSSLGSARLTTVARQLSLSSPTVCAKIDELEAAGLLTRHRSERDRRAVELVLTAKGRKVETRIWARIGEMFAEATVDLPEEDLATAVRVFRAINGRLGERRVAA